MRSNSAAAGAQFSSVITPATASCLLKITRATLVGFRSVDRDNDQLAIEPLG
jgi:hypothetical protein